MIPVGTLMPLSATPERSLRRDRLPLLVGTGLVVLALLAYGPIWRNDFIDLDDQLYITQNPHVIAGLSPEGIRWAWTTFHGGFWFPLTWMSLELDGSLSRLFRGLGSQELLQAYLFHGQNLLWHTATVVLLFVTLRWLTGALWRSALVAALFAVHPLHVESVAWATERKDVLSAFFCVLTLLAYGEYSARPSLAGYLLVTGSFVLGLLAKPMLVTLPFVLLLLDWWPLRRWGSAFSPFRLVLEKLPLLVLALAASGLTLLAKQQVQAIVAVNQISLPARLANAVVSYAWYLEKTVWPNGLALFYTHPQENWHWPPVLAASAFMLAISLFVLGPGRKWPWLPVGWLWFVGTLVPVIGLVQAGEQARADRFVYLPHIGLLIALVWSGAALLKPTHCNGWACAGLTAVCLVLLSAATWVQVTHWRNFETIWEHTLAVTSRNHRAHACLGQGLYQQAQTRGVATTLERARYHWEEAVTIRPDCWEYRAPLGEILLIQGKLEEAARHLTAAVQLEPGNAAIWHNLGVTQRRLGKDREAEKSFRRGLELNPQAPDTRAELGLVLWRLDRREEAETEWREALAGNPSEPEALHGMGLVLLRRGEVQEAVEKFQAAVANRPILLRAWVQGGIALGRLGNWQPANQCFFRAIELETDRIGKHPGTDPTDLASFHCWLAYTLQAQGRFQEAAAEYEKASQLDRDWRHRQETLAWQLATSPKEEQRDAALARELASQVCQASRNPSAEALDALGAALAGLGRFEEAVKAAEQALAAAGPRQAEAIRSRIALYRGGKAFRVSSD